MRMARRNWMTLKHVRLCMIMVTMARKIQHSFQEGDARGMDHEGKAGWSQIYGGMNVCNLLLTVTARSCILCSSAPHVVRLPTLPCVSYHG